MKLDFRSDTVTHPTQEMRNAMALAPVGDDVYEDDPTVNELQAYASELFQTEAALYVCSGTMGNLLAILCHCDRGDGVLVGKEAHIWSHEAGGMACIAGTMPFQLDDSAGIPSVEEIRAQYRAPGDVHVCPTTLLALENTHNFMGGLPIAPAVFAEVAGTARALGMKVHLDGARLFNACTAFEVPPSRYAAEVDSVQVCLSKGLGAPMGSMLCGKRTFIEKARMWRKKLGGGQRQVGIAAAAGMVALRDMRGRLVQDHENASYLAELLENTGVAVEPVSHRTNMVFFQLPKECSEDLFVKQCADRGLLLNGAGNGRIRMVTHLDVDRQAVGDAALLVREVLA